MTSKKLNIIEDLSREFNGEFIEEAEHKMHSPHGAYISQNSKAKLLYNGIEFYLYSFANKGIRDPFNFEGSPFRLVVYTNNINKHISINPKGFISKFFSPLTSKNHLVYSKYKFKGSKDILASIRNNQNLLDLMLKRNFVVFSKIDKVKTKVVLTPTDSVLSKESMQELMEIICGIINKRVPT